MAGNVNYQPKWTEEASQCKNCKSFQSKDGKDACVPPGKSFEAALAEYGQVAKNGHCNYFQAK